MTKRGFTFLEVMVTVGLIVVVLTISSVAYRRGARRTEVILFAQQVASDIRQAESFAASGRNKNEQEGVNIWGARFSKANPDTYVIYAEANGNGYTSGEEFRTGHLSKTVNIDEVGCLEANGDKVAKAYVDINYTPPDPSVSLRTDGSSCANVAYIVLRDKVTNSTKELQVNFFGLVDVTR